MSGTESREQIEGGARSPLAASLRNLSHELEKETSSTVNPLRHVPREITSLSFLTPNDRINELSWGSLYLALGERMPHELTSCLFLLDTTGIPNPLRSALTSHLIAFGKESPAYTYVRAFWSEYNREMLRSPAGAGEISNMAQGMRGMNPNPGDTINFHMWSGPVHITQATTKALRVLPGLEHRTVGPINSVGNFPPSLDITWETLEALEKGTLKEIPWEEAHIQMASNNRDRAPWAPRILLKALDSLGSHRLVFNEDLGDLENIAAGINAVKDVVSRVVELDYLGEEVDLSLARTILASQENFPSVMDAFGALVREYNREWALAAMEWNPEGGEPSQVYSAMQESVRNSPWGVAKTEEE